MRKRILAALAAAMVFTSAVTPNVVAFAEGEDPVGGEGGGEQQEITIEYEEYGDGDTAETDITIHVVSDFSVRIPKSIVAYEDTVDYIVGVRGSISDTEKVVVKPEDSIDFTLEIEGTVEDTKSATVTQEKQKWYSNELDTEIWTEALGTIDADEPLTAGDWTSVLTFTVSLEAADDIAEIKVTDEESTGYDVEITELTGEDRANLLTELTDEGKMTQADTLLSLISTEVEGATFEATESLHGEFDLKYLAAEGDNIKIFRYITASSEWEQLGITAVLDNTLKVTIDFTAVDGKIGDLAIVKLGN